MKEQSLPAINNPKSLSKDTLAEYVSGAMEMETHKYTLEETIKNHKSERDKYQQNSQREFESAQRRYDSVKSDYDEAKKRAETYSFKTYLSEWRKERKSREGSVKVGVFFGFLFIHYFFGAITIVSTTFLFPDLPIWNSILIGATVWLTLFFMIRQRIRKFRYIRNKKEYKNSFVSGSREFVQEKEKFQNAQNKYDDKMRSVAKMDEQISLLENNVAELNKNIAVYYKQNIIPPDYRNINCVVMIDYVFRNDQADTMREATLLCDQRIRATVGLQALRELSETMRGIGNTLNSIQNNIEYISQDISDIAISQNTIISQTKATRYSIDALKSSAELLEWRINNKQ